jgi:hypothetical protein
MKQLEKRFPRCPICNDLVGFDETKNELTCLRVKCKYRITLEELKDW